MQAIKCELCGSNEFTKVEGLFQCNHCNTKYTLEEAKKLMVSGTVEVVTGNAEKERLLKNAETFIALEKVEEAESIFFKLTKEYPNDYRGWVGLFKCQCLHNFADDTPFNTKRAYIEFVSKYHQYFFGICDIATTIQKLNDSMDEEIVAHISMYLENIFNIPKHTGVYFEFFRSNFDKLGKLKKYFLEKYEKVQYFDKIRSDFEKLTSRILKFQIFDDISRESKIIYHSTDYKRTANYSDRIIECLFYYENYIGFHIHATPWEELEKIVIFETNHKLENIINDKIEEQQQINRMNADVCLYCGGVFKGIFKKVCSNCGKPKDY